jgi:hypothetical protein
MYEVDPEIGKAFAEGRWRLRKGAMLWSAVLYEQGIGMKSSFDL